MPDDHQSVLRRSSLGKILLLEIMLTSLHLSAPLSSYLMVAARVTHLEHKKTSIMVHGSHETWQRIEDDA